MLMEYCDLRWPDCTGPPKGGHYGKLWADRATVVKMGYTVVPGLITPSLGTITMPFLMK